PTAKPRVLEPVLKLDAERPDEHQGGILTTIMPRRGTVIGTTESAGLSRIESEVPLSEMFGYATDLRSMTQGTAEFSMEFARYLPAPAEIQKELKEKFSSKIVDDGE
ncbi:MAG: elongation factor G, partial [Myxococcota bacterium]